LSHGLIEDQALHDATTLATIDPQQRASATVITQEDCVLAGLGCIQRVYELYGELEGKARAYPEISIAKEIFDGMHLRSGQIIATIRHNARVLLSCERLILNVLQRMSGIATETSKYVAAVKGTGAVILDTRKTTPNFRFLEKYAVRMGGGRNHRFGLYDGILVKDNHITAAGGIIKAMADMRKKVHPLLKIDISGGDNANIDRPLPLRADRFHDPLLDDA